MAAIFAFLVALTLGGFHPASATAHTPQPTPVVHPFDGTGIMPGG